ncbi:hypothetical protein AAVH_22697 [Aphelenchoides avenae]|nr:hypothetical protein AAVH_22697 [Aphelenchus avenae]
MTLQTSGTSRVACSTPTFGRGTDLDLGREVAVKEESLHYAENIQYVIDPHESEAMHLDVEAERKPPRLDDRRETANVDDNNNPTPTTMKTNGASRVTCSAATPGTRKRFAGSLSGSKPPTKKSAAEVVTIDDSDDDTETNGTSSDTSSAPNKPVKREPVENNDAVRPRDHLTVRYTSASGMVLKVTHMSAQMTFRDFRQTFGISQSTLQVFVFIGNDGEWEVIRDCEATLPVIKGHVEARAHHED